MLEGVAKDHVGVETLGIAARRGPERNEDVGVLSLRLDEGLDVGLAAIELAQHLVGRVPAAGAVARKLHILRSSSGGARNTRMSWAPASLGE